MPYLQHMRISVRVTPRASRDAIDGIGEAGVLRVRVTAAPANGAANKAVTKLLAKTLGLAPRDVVLVSGASSRTKVFEVPLNADDLSRQLPRV